jgi:hypothetical protein
MLTAEYDYFTKSLQETHSIPQFYGVWYIGNREKKIALFRFIKTTDLTGEHKKNKKYNQTGGG